MSTTPARSALRYSTELPFLEELFTRIGPGGGFGVETATLAGLLELLRQFLEQEFAKAEPDGARIEKVLGFEEILGSLLSTGFPEGAEIIPYNRLPEAAPAEQAAVRKPEPRSLCTKDAEAGWSCPICFEPRGTAVTLHACGEHHYCLECMGGHLTSLIVDNEVTKISCPAPGCPATVLECEVRLLVPEPIWEKYLDFLFLAVLREEENSRWCTNLKCGMPIIWDPSTDGKVVTCPACKTDFCFTCSRPWHPGYSCEGQPLPDVEQQFIEWLKTKKALVKKCPGCAAPLEKNDGCNHMTCRCGANWCWLCRERMENTNHFGEGPCEGFQFAKYNTRRQAVAARDGQPIPPDDEDEEPAPAEPAAASSSAPAAPPPAPVSVGCQFCNQVFPSYSALFSHQGSGQCSRSGAMTRSREIFRRSLGASS